MAGTAKKKKRDEDEVHAEVDVGELVSRVDNLTAAVKAQNETIKLLMGNLYADEPPPPGKRKRVIRADGEGAKNARIGRGAGRRGWDYKGWLEAFGRKEYPELTAKQKKKADKGQPE